MAVSENPRTQPVRPQRQVRDLPGCIKYILLTFLILLLLAEIWAGEFRRLGEGNWIVWIILLLKLILIIGLIILIKVQKDLKCDLTGPTGCTEEEPDPVEGILFVRVMGTAGGAVFGHYILEVRKAADLPSDPPISNVVLYPGGGPSGAVPVFGGELGRIDTTSLSDDAYTVTLRVFPAGPGPSTSDTTSFNLLKSIVYINRVAQVPAISMAPVPDNPNPLDPDAELRSGGDVKSVGGNMTIAGSAYIYECAGRKIKSYEIRYAKIVSPGGEPAQPLKDDPVPALWPAGNRVLPLPLEYTLPDQYAAWTRVGPASINLINSWKTMTIGSNTYYKLNPGVWGSGAAGNGRFSFLLFAEDTAGHRYFDIQHVWIDNRPILGEIVKFQRLVNGVWTDIPPCADILISFGKLRIMGLAWDPLIDDAWPVAAPNDNFGYYNLSFSKQFGPSFTLLGNTPTRVPALPAGPPFPVPTDADAGELAQWNLAGLDAGPIPNPYAPPPQPKIYRGEACSYIVTLFVTDTTVVNEGSTHHIHFPVPLKIINDL